MLTEIEIQANKDKFVKLVNTLITRPNADVEGLLNKLDKSDFYYAPASVKYIGSYAGGLCEYCLNLYNKMVTIVNDPKISAESVAIVSLFSALYKMNYYVADVRNVKVYKPNGSKSDSRGRFDWETQDYYRVKDAEDRFIFGTNGETSEFMLRYFIPLTVDESKAIINACRSFEDGMSFMSDVFATSDLTVYLHCAYMLTTYIKNKPEEVLTNESIY